jgi:hypothetical protein
VNVSISFERRLYNITSDPQTIEPHIDFEEWGIHDHPSGLDFYKVQIDGEEAHDATRCPDGPGGRLVYKVKKTITVPSKKSILITAKYHETRYKNDQMMIAFNNPSKNPTVRVSLPDKFKHTCSFGIPGEIFESSLIEERHTLEGTQFPGQETKIRWWPAS